LSDSATAAPVEFELSVVVALTSARPDSLRDCLRSVEKSCDGISTEIIVPHDERLADAELIAGEFAAAKFLDCRGRVPAGTPPHGHVRFDILRAEGLKAAVGRVVALIEDCEIVDDGWARAMLAAHDGRVGVVSGAIENATNSLLAEALYLFDFAAYSPARPAGLALTASDANVSYRLEMLRELRESWSPEYDEKSFHEEVLRRDVPILFEPGALVYQKRRGMKTLDALQERFEWGRWYAGTCLSAMSSARRLTFLLCAWILPVVLTLRAVPASLSPRRLQLSVFVLPVVFVLRTAWIFGEWCGYVMPRYNPVGPSRG